MDQNNIISLLEAERTLGIPNLRKYICEEVIGTVTIKNYSFFFEMSKMFYLKKLQDFFHNFFVQCYLTKSRLEVFYNLGYQDVLGIVSSSELRIDSELQIFNFIADWITHKHSERKSYLNDLLERVRLPLLSEEIILDVLKLHRLCSDSLNCENIFDKALEIKRNKRNFMKSILLQNRFYNEKHDDIDVMFIVDESSKSYSSVSLAYRIDGCEINKVKKLASINRQKRTDAAVVLGTKIYCIGSCELRSWSIDSFEVYCRTTDTWSVLEKAPTEINKGFCACSFMGKIYAFGGYGSVASAAYSPERSAWQRVASMSSKRSVKSKRSERYRASCASFNGQIVVVGGDSSKRVESYDHHPDEWSDLSPMRVDRVSPGVVARGNKLFVIGGHGKTHEVYDCLTEQFTFIAASSVSVYHNMNLVASGSSVFVFGRVQLELFDTEETNLEVPTYDILQDKWSITNKKFIDRPKIWTCSIVTLHKFLT